ncbi:hypothetical protein HNV08_01900 [Winogradskyella eckloniae]|uniref:hypothetical protein n=1 Tax=Winogradskyella eckloniae TaxID=1089306 RepID=UPI001565D16B|nr:hypothetical protein [Winogradskyella eckloniae]NRD18786.1 hypothetical protein [Winogradskyella eckloniae]
MKINLKSLSIVCIFFLTFGCVNEFEDDVRILVKGNVVNNDGAPIESAQISVYTKRPRGIFVSSGYDEYLLGRGYSDGNGEFSVTSILDLDDEFSIEIDAEDQLSKYRYYTNTINYIPPNLVYDLNTVELKSLATLHYNITRTSGEGHTLDYSFKYTNIYCVDYYELGSINESQSYCYNDLIDYRVLNDISSDVERSLSTTLGATIEFRYAIDDQPEIIETFTIDQPTYEFNFSY